MTHGYVHVSSNNVINQIIMDLDEASKPSFKVTAKLEAVLGEAFVNTQALTHVITGSLKMSGKVSSDFDGHKWSGKIEYGGSSAGVNNPVDYAIYEMARGGDHDFFRELPAYEEKFGKAVNSAFPG